MPPEPRYQISSIFAMHHAVSCSVNSAWLFCNAESSSSMNVARHNRFLATPPLSGNTSNGATSSRYLQSAVRGNKVCSAARRYHAVFAKGDFFTITTAGRQASSSQSCIPAPHHRGRQRNRPSGCIRQIQPVICTPLQAINLSPWLAIQAMTLSASCCISDTAFP